MAGIVIKLHEKKLISPPKWLPLNIQYETIMGSVAYGVSNDLSDCDVYGFCIPPVEYVFPHTAGYIIGFDAIPNFEQYQQHHILEGEKNYDISIYGIVKYFKLVMENNPNMIDSLFTPQTCIKTCTKVGTLVRENRKIFLHKGSWHRFKGYSYQQMHKMDSKNPTGKRLETVEKYGFDVKFAYHIVRLLLEVEQILLEGDLDLTRNAEQLKEIRRGKWNAEDIRKYFVDKEQQLEKLYTESHLRNKPDQAKIKELLLHCLEEHYGSLDKLIKPTGQAETILQQIRDLIL